MASTGPFAVPEETFIKPLFKYEKEPILFNVAPFTHRPALTDKLGFDLNWNTPFVSFNNPFEIIIFPVLDIIPIPFASRTDDILVPLLTKMVLKAEAEFPLIVLFADPLNVTVPVPALRVPSFVQSPFISRLILALNERVPLIVILLHVEAASTVTVDVFTMITSFVAVGRIPPTHVAVELQLPPAAVEEICA